jgi:hypothetical protein
MDCRSESTFSTGATSPDGTAPSTDSDGTAPASDLDWPHAAKANIEKPTQQATTTLDADLSKRATFRPDISGSFNRHVVKQNVPCGGSVRAIGIAI